MLERSKKIVFLEHSFTNTGFSFSKSLFIPQDILNCMMTVMTVSKDNTAFE